MYGARLGLASVVWLALIAFRMGSGELLSGRSEFSRRGHAVGDSGCLGGSPLCADDVEPPVHDPLRVHDVRGVVGGEQWRGRPRRWGGLGGLVGFAGLNGPIVGSPGDEPMARVDGVRVGRALASSAAPPDSVSGDFEDQAWHQASAEETPRPRTATVAAEGARRRRPRVGRPSQANAAVRRPTTGSKR